MRGRIEQGVSGFAFLWRHLTDLSLRGHLLRFQAASPPRLASLVKLRPLVEQPRRRKGAPRAAALRLEILVAGLRQGRGAQLLGVAPCGARSLLSFLRSCFQRGSRRRRGRAAHEREPGKGKRSAEGPSHGRNLTSPAHARPFRGRLLPISCVASRMSMPERIGANLSARPSAYTAPPTALALRGGGAELEARTERREERRRRASGTIPIRPTTFGCSRTGGESGRHLPAGSVAESRMATRNIDTPRRPACATKTFPSATTNSSGLMRRPSPHPR